MRSCRNVLRCFSSYLCNRSRNVWQKNCIPEVYWSSAKNSALLFILYIKDIATYLKFSKICMLVDDRMLYINETDISETMNYINRDLISIYSVGCVRTV